MTDDEITGWRELGVVSREELDVGQMGWREWTFIRYERDERVLLVYRLSWISG